MAKRKRGNSEGSIYRMKDGRWRAAITTGKDAGGKPKRRVFTAATRHEVAIEMTKALRDQQHGINVNPERKTVAEFLGLWLESLKRDVAPATYAAFRKASSKGRFFNEFIRDRHKYHRFGERQAVGK